MSHILRLECTLLGRICPRETLIQIDATIEGTDANEDAPTDRFQHLQVFGIQDIAIKKHLPGSQVNRKDRCLRGETLTMPATTRPPTVPCDPIEDMANREISDNCSGVMPPTPGVGNRQTGVVSTGVLTGVTTVCCKKYKKEIPISLISSKRVACAACSPQYCSGD